MKNRPCPGCLMGFIKLFFLDKIYHWLQRTIGFKRGGCLGCGCGTFYSSFSSSSQSQF